MLKEAKCESRGEQTVTGPSRKSDTSLIHICSCQLREHSAERTLNVTVRVNTEMCADRFKAKSRDEREREKKTVKTARQKTV